MHILHSEASEHWGGQEIRTFMDAERMRRRGHEVTILNKPGGKLFQRARAAGFRVVELGSHSPWDPRAVLAVARLLTGLGVDVVHTHSSADSWTAGLAARYAGRTLVRTRHISAPMGKRSAKPVYRLPDAIIATSEAIRDTLVGLGIDPERVRTLPSGVDLSRFRPRDDARALRSALGLTGQPVISMVAELRREKRADIFLEAAAGLLREWPGALFVLAGGGSTAAISALERQAAGLGISTSVRLLGHREDVPEIIAASDVCVLPSAGHEGTPQAVVQYLAMAKPVVAAAVGGIPEVIEEGHTGLLVRPGDATGLARSVAWLLRHPEEARMMGAAGRRLACERFDAERVAERTLAIYEELLRRKRAA
jgi:glycosyltransferase involved in cell wall biosynthesis